MPAATTNNDIKRIRSIEALPLYTIKQPQDSTGMRQRTQQQYSLSSSSSSVVSENASEHSTITVDRSFRNKQQQQHHQPISPKSRRSVNFAPSEHIKLIPSLDEYDCDDIDAIWYNAEEMQELRQDARDVVQRAQSGGSSHSTSECLRGLESRLPAQSKQRQANKSQGWRSVLDEQERQWDSFAMDENKIAAAYAQVSSQAQANAFRVGRMDRIVARSG